MEQSLNAYITIISPVCFRQVMFKQFLRKFLFLFNIYICGFKGGEGFNGPGPLHLILFALKNPG